MWIGAYGELKNRKRLLHTHENRMENADMPTNWPAIPSRSKLMCIAFRNILIDVCAREFRLHSYGSGPAAEPKTRQFADSIL